MPLADCGQQGSEGVMVCSQGKMAPIEVHHLHAHTQDSTSHSPTEYLHSVGVRDLDANSIGRSVPY